MMRLCASPCPTWLCSGSYMSLSQITSLDAESKPLCSWTFFLQINHRVNQIEQVSTCVTSTPRHGYGCFSSLQHDRGKCERYYLLELFCQPNSPGKDISSALKAQHGPPFDVAMVLVGFLM